MALQFGQSELRIWWVCRPSICHITLLNRPGFYGRSKATVWEGRGLWYGWGWGGGGGRREGTEKWVGGKEGGGGVEGGGDQEDRGKSKKKTILEMTEKQSKRIVYKSCKNRYIVYNAEKKCRLKKTQITQWIQGMGRRNLKNHIHKWKKKKITHPTFTAHLYAEIKYMYVCVLSESLKTLTKGALCWLSARVI